jgi:predicted aspartyl protease
LTNCGTPRTLSPDVATREIFLIGLKRCDAPFDYESAPNVSYVADDPANSRNTIVQKINDNRYYAPVKIGSKLFTYFILDTGATMSTMSVEIARAMFCRGELNESNIAGVTTATLANASSVYVPLISIKNVQVGSVIYPDFQVLVIGTESLLGIEKIYKIDLEAKTYALRHNPRSCCGLTEIAEHNPD